MAIIAAIMDTHTARPRISAATRLLTWLSPAFPVGGFSYSHGLEYAIGAGLVRDRATLREWIVGILRFGAGRGDGLLLLAAHRAATSEDPTALCEWAERAAAQRSTAELALEATAQGRAFWKAVRGGWPELVTAEPLLALAASSVTPTYPIAVGTLAAAAGLEEAIVLDAYLAAFAGNLVSAGIRLVPLGQSDGVAIQAALEPLIQDLAIRFRLLDPADIGTAVPMVDWTSMQHETQYTRLFRS